MGDCILKVKPEISGIGDLEVHIPDMMRFITAKSKKAEVCKDGTLLSTPLVNCSVVVVSKPSFDVSDLMKRLLDPKVLITQLNKGLKYLSNKLIGGGSVINKIPIKWLKGKILTVMRSSGGFIESFRPTLIATLMDVFVGSGEESKDFRTAIRDLLRKFLPKAILNTNDYNGTIGNEPISCTNCTSGNVLTFHQAIEAGMEWTVHLGQSRSFPVGDLDLGFGPVPIKLKIDDISFELGWTLDLTFGFKQDTGFYMKRNGEGTPDFKIQAGLKVPELRAEADLFLLQLEVTDYRSRLLRCRCKNECNTAHFDGEPNRLSNGEIKTCKKEGKISSATREFVERNMIDISMAAYLMPNATSDYITLKTLKSRKGSLLGVEARASLQVLFAIKATTITPMLPAVDTLLHGEISYTKAFGGGAKGGVFVRHLDFLYPSMDVGSFLGASILPPLIEISAKMRPIVKPLKMLVKEQPLLTMLLGRKAGTG